MKEEIKQFKTALKALYDWQKANVGTYIEGFTTSTGLDVNIEYKTYINGGDYEWESLDAQPAINDTQRKTFALIGLVDNDDIINNVDIYQLMKDHLRYLADEYSDVISDLEDNDNNDILYNCGLDLDELISYRSTFDELWESLTEYIVVEHEVELNDQYSAIITEGSNDVTVGCQSFNIEQIRKLVRTWDEVND